MTFHSIPQRRVDLDRWPRGTNTCIKHVGSFSNLNIYWNNLSKWTCTPSSYCIWRNQHPTTSKTEVKKNLIQATPRRPRHWNQHIAGAKEEFGKGGFARWIDHRCDGRRLTATKGVKIQHPGNKYHPWWVVWGTMKQSPSEIQDLWDEVVGIMWRMKKESCLPDFFQPAPEIHICMFHSPWVQDDVKTSNFPSRMPPKRYLSPFKGKQKLEHPDPRETRLPNSNDDDDDDDDGDGEEGRHRMIKDNNVVMSGPLNRFFLHSIDLGQRDVHH